jgi:hypothetical protein
MNSNHEWTKDETKILVSWCQKSAGQRWLHDKACRHYRKINNRFSYVSIILSTIAGIGGFSAETSMAWFRYLLASVNIFTGLLNSFQKFVRAAEKSEAHMSVARQFASFVRTVALELSLEPEKRENASDFLKQCKSDYERMCTMAPDVPERVIRAFNAKFPDVKNRPDMCNGMSTMEFSYWKPGTKTLTDAALRKLKILRGWKDQVPEFREPV